MSIVAIARRNWALRLSVVLNVCVLLYVCAHFGSSGPWIEEPPTNWAAAAPLQSDTYGGTLNDIVNGTQKGAAAASSSSSSAAVVGATNNAAPTNNGASHPLRIGLVTTTPPNGAKAEALDKSQEHSLNQTVFTPSVFHRFFLFILSSLIPSDLEWLLTLRLIIVYGLSNC